MKTTKSTTVAPTTRAHSGERESCWSRVDAVVDVEDYFFDGFFVERFDFAVLALALRNAAA
jgi:hypothetical protein